METFQQNDCYISLSVLRKFENRQMRYLFWLLLHFIALQAFHIPESIKKTNISYE